MPSHLTILQTELAKFNDPSQRRQIKQVYVDQIEAANPPSSALLKLREASDFTGEDFTSLMSPFQGARIDPIAPEEARKLFDDARIKVPAWRRAVQKLGAAVEVYERKVLDPTVGSILAATFSLIPGDQAFDKRLQQAQTAIAAERAQTIKKDSLGDFTKAAAEAYRTLDTPWGLKGFAELIFDPLNLVGLGLPGKLGTKVPALKPLLVPLNIIDKAPEFLLKKSFQASAEVIKRTPVLKAFAQPHHTTQVKQAYERTFQEVSGRFGGAQMIDGTADDTRRLLSGMTSFPEDAGPYSLRNLWNHMAEAIGEKKYLLLEDELRQMAPLQATERIAEEIAFLEREAILKGGGRVRVGGEVVEQSLRQRRGAGIQSVLERLHFDEQNAKGIAAGIEQFIHGPLDRIYTRKIEPMLVRPWSMSFLATAGFPVGNVVESLGISATAYGGLGKLGWNDESFRLLSAGLKVHPSMMTAQEQIRSFIGTKTGIFDNPRSTPFSTLGNVFGGWFIKLSNAVEWPIKRSAFINRYFNDFHKEMTALGVPKQTLDNMKDFVMTEYPDGLNHLREEVAGSIVGMMTSGNTDHIRELGRLTSSARIIQKAQMDALQELMDLPPDARRVLYEGILSEGGINTTNREFIEEAVRKEVLEHHKFTPEYIEGELFDFVDNLKNRKAASPAEATGVLRMLQHAGDTIAQMPREVRAHYRQLTRRSGQKEKAALWQEADDIITKSLSKLRTAYDEALETNKADISNQLDKIVPTAAGQEAVRRSIDDIFSSYSAISKNLDSTWEEHLSRRRARFDETPIDERDNAFWREIEDMGDEIWTREKEFRATQANTARTGWNALFDVMPKDVTGRDREFIRGGLQAALGDAEVRQNELQVLLHEMEQKLETLPTALKPERQARIAEVKTQLSVAAASRTELETKLSRFGELPKARVPAALREADTAVRHVREAMKAAEEAGLGDTLPELRRQLIEANKRAESTFDQFVPMLHRPEWETLKATRNAVQSQLSQETLVSARQPLELQLKRLNANVTRFQKRIRSGEAMAEAERVTGFKNRLILQAADQVSNAIGGGIPESIEAVERVLRELGEEGNIVANDIFTHMDELATRLSRERPDIAKPKTQLVHYSSKTGLTETDPKFFGTGANSEEIRSGRAFEEGFQKRTYFYTVDTPTEPVVTGVAGKKYFTEVDTDLIYNLADDPQDFRGKFRDPTKMENAITEAGFIGFSNGNRVAVFQKMGVGNVTNVGQQKLKINKTILDKVVEATKNPEIRGSSVFLDGQDATVLARKGTVGRFAVGAYPDREVVTAVDEFNDVVLRKFMEENRDLLSMEGNFVGAFWSPDGNVYLDVSKAINKKSEAMALASAREQDSIFDMISSNVLDTEAIPSPLGVTREEVFSSIYSKAAEIAERSDLNPLELDTLRRIVIEDVRPTAAVTRLIQEGYTTPPVRLRNGEFRMELTEKGQEALQRTPQQPDVDSVIAGLPDAVQTFDSIIDSQMAEVTTAMDDMLKLQQNPPLRTDQEGTLQAYFNRVADELDRQPDLVANIKTARVKANETALKEWDDWFINYDGKSSGDFVMQRFVPFWMYASRRWPRIARLAAKRPVLTKYIAAGVSDHDYGYTPTPGGFEFSAFRGHLLSGIRRTAMRDFPDLQSGYRGNLEQGIDWLGRFGLYLNPLISGTSAILSGEPGQLIPPPISLALHGLVGAGATVPEPFGQLAFSDRLTNFVLDQVIAEEFKKSPTEVRNLAEAGDEQAIGVMHVARIVAARKILTMNQAGVLRYRPPGKREFIEATNVAVEEVLGVPRDMQDAARDLGLSVYEVVSSSAPQRKWMQENLKDYDQWFGAGLSLKPLAEQEALRRVDAFWFDVERMREVDKAARDQLSDNWIRGLESGPNAIKALGELRRIRSVAFDTLHSRPEYKDVPITMEQRIAYLQRFDRPSPLPNPVDEALEQYYSLNPENYVDELSGETNWNAFFSDQESILAQFEPQIQQVIINEIGKADTDLERMMKLGSPFLRQYYGVRDDIIQTFEAQNPQLSAAWREYRRLGNLAKRSLDVDGAQHLARQQWDLLASNPQLALMEKLVSETRKRMRQENPEMERFYQMFIARPQGVTVPKAPRKLKLNF